jgi:hypothetical protein
MVAINEDVPVSCAAIYGSYEWRLGNFRPVSVAWSSPLSFDGLPRGGKGYKEASVEIEREIRKLWDWLAGVHELGRPRDATPPTGPTSRSPTSRSRHGRDRLPERRQVDVDQLPHVTRTAVVHDARRHLPSQGASRRSGTTFR